MAHSEAGFTMKPNDSQKDDAIVFTADSLLRTSTPQTSPALCQFVFGYFFECLGALGLVWGAYVVDGGASMKPPPFSPPPPKPAPPRQAPTTQL